MPRLNKNFAAILVVAAVFAAGSLLAWRTFGTNGQDAVDRMSPDERAYLVKLQSLRKGMSFDEVVDILGPPDDDGPLQMRPRWNVNGNPLSGVAIYFFADGARRFTWISIGRFTYQEQLRKEGKEMNLTRRQ